MPGVRQGHASPHRYIFKNRQGVCFSGMLRVPSLQFQRMGTVIKQSQTPPSGPSPWRFFYPKNLPIKQSKNKFNLYTILNFITYTQIPSNNPYFYPQQCIFISNQLTHHCQYFLFDASSLNYESKKFIPKNSEKSLYVGEKNYWHGFCP